MCLFLLKQMSNTHQLTRDVGFLSLLTNNQLCVLRNPKHVENSNVPFADLSQPFGPRLCNSLVLYFFYMIIIRHLSEHVKHFVLNFINLLRFYETSNKISST